MKKFFLLVIVVAGVQAGFSQTDNTIIIITPTPAFKPTYQPPITPARGLPESNPANYPIEVDYTHADDPFWYLHEDNDSKRKAYIGKPRYKAKSVVNLRTGAGANEPIITQIYQGEYVYVMNTSVPGYFYTPTQGWWLVYHSAGEQYGWVKSSLLVSDPDR